MLRRHRNIAATLAVVGVLAAGWGTSGPGHLSAQASREQDLYLSVLTPAGVPVPNLQPDDVIVRENGMRREVLRMRRATDPIDLAVLVDTSQAATPMVQDIRKGLAGFVDRMHDLATIAVVGFGERPTVLVNYTRDSAALAKGISRIFATRGSGAYMLEGISEVANGLDKRDASRLAIVVISAGGVEFSTASYVNVLDQLVKSGAALHVITVGTGGVAMDDERRNREILIDQGTRRTGGWRRQLLDQMSIPGALDRLATELLNQYRITYARPESLVPPDPPEVSSRTEGLVVRATPVRVRRSGA